MFVIGWKWQKGIKIVPSPPFLSFESPVTVKENSEVLPITMKNSGYTPYKYFIGGPEKLASKNGVLITALAKRLNNLNIRLLLWSFKLTFLC